MKNAIKKSSLLLVMMVLAGTIFAGCGNKNEEELPEETPVATEAPAETQAPATAEPEPEPAAGAITVEASSAQDPNLAVNTLDGNHDDESRWSAEAQWAHITYDLGAEKTIGSLDIAFAMADKQQTAFDIQVSNDGTTFTNVLLDAKCAATLGFQNFKLDPAAKGKFVRIVGKYNNSGEWGQWVSIAEVEVKDEAGAKIVPVSAAASSEPQPEFTAALTMDGNVDDASRWSAESVFPTITYNLGAVKKVSSLDLDFAMNKDQLTTFDIQVSTDGTTFTFLKFDQINTNEAAEFENFKLDAPVDAQYVRLRGKHNSTGEWTQWISLAEAKINVE